MMKDVEMSRIKMLILILILSISFLITTKVDVKSNSEIIRVPEDYPVIQWAINAAEPGDTILVSSGIYYERIVINKTLNLIGENKWTTILDGLNTGDVITVKANGVKISGFTIRKAGTHTDIYNCGIRLQASHCIILNNLIRDAYTCISIAGDYNVIKQNIIKVSIWGGIGVEIEIGADNNILLNNLVTGEETAFSIGLDLTYCSKNKIVGNTISNHQWGIRYQASGNILFHNNFIGNIDQVYDYSSGENNWDNGAEGNYWSDYRG